jgi:hypothetical protein
VGVPNQVVSWGFTLEDFIFTYLMSGTPSTSDVGKAVSLDTTGTNTVKLTADGDVIFGRLETFEDRTLLSIKVGAVARKFKNKLPAAVGHGIAVGDRIVGAAGGLVKKDAAASASNPIVVEVGTDFVVAEKL